MTADLVRPAANGAHAPAKDEEQVPHNHADAEEDGDDGEEDGVPEAGAGGACPYSTCARHGADAVALVDAKKKKKKKKPKKKAAKAEQQTEPPRIGLSKLFPDGNYPEGELQDYKDECVHYAVLRPLSLT